MKTGFVFALAGVLLLAVSFIPGVGMNLTLPLAFWMSGIVFLWLERELSTRYSWPGVLNIPGCLLIAVAVVLSMNVLTGDWRAWAYAWLLLVAGVGLGITLAARRMRWPDALPWIGNSLLVLGCVFFLIFGVIAGGLFIQIMAPALLITGGLATRFLGLERLLMGPRPTVKPTPTAAAETEEAAPAAEALAEPLSARELEVLRLIDAGLTNAEIAARLTLAQSTVKTHINNIYGKLGVQTRVQALNRARDLGLL